MEVKLLGALDYEKVRKMLKEKLQTEELEVGDNRIEEVIKELKDLEKSRKAEIVSSAGRLSRFAGDVMEIVGLSEGKTLEQNSRFVSKVVGYGHDSITDHDYCVFALKDISPIVEQTIIEERFASFTIKSRREVNFANVGFYVPDFHDDNKMVLANNKEIQEEYSQYMKSLFAFYQELVEKKIPMEDARFVLPYSYHSNIIMGMDAHSLKNLIIKLTKTKYANIQELREFGEQLYKIVQEQMPYLISSIDSIPAITEDPVEQYLNQTVAKEPYTIPSAPKLLNGPENVDDQICVAAIMRKYQYDAEKAELVLKKACSVNPNFKKELIRKIAFEGDGIELSQVNFDFQIPLSLSILTHLTRHRTHPIMTPDFVPNLDLTQYKIPPTIRRTCEDEYNDIFKRNLDIYNHFKNDYGIREEDLVYFTLSGNMTSSITNMDGKTLEHILRLRECNKAQWETRQMAVGMHREINSLKGAEEFSNILGSTCTTQGICREGRECCGKVYTLKNCRMPKKNSES